MKKIVTREGQIKSNGLVSSDSYLYYSGKDILASVDSRKKDFVDGAEDLILSVDGLGKVLFANQRWLDTLGYRQTDLSKISLADVIRDDKLQRYVERLGWVIRGENQEFVETVFKTRDGRDVYAEGRINGSFSNGCFVLSRGIFRDITPSKAVEETYSLLVRNSPAPIYVLTNGLLHLMNPAFLALTGYSESELAGKNPLDLVHPADREFVRKSAIRTLKAHKPTGYEFRIICKSGEVRWVMETVISIPAAEGNATLGTMVDLTERRIVEAALQESKNRYQTLFNSASDSIYIVDAQNRFLDVNDSASKLLGYSRGDFLRLNLNDVETEQHFSLTCPHADELDESGYFTYESKIINRSGRHIPVEARSRIIEYENNKAVMTVLRDITERKQIDYLRMRNQARFESLIKIAQYKPGRIRDLLYFALEEVIKVTESNLGFLYFYDENRREFSFSAWSKEVMKVSTRSGRIDICPLERAGILGESIRQRKPVLINSQQVPALYNNGYPEGHYQLRTYFLIPVFRDQKIVALVSVANKATDYDQSDIQLLSLTMDSAWNIIERWQAEEAMRESELRYRQIVELYLDGLLRLDEKGTIVMANPAACKMFGYTEKEFLVLPLAETYPPAERQILSERLNQLKEKGALRYERHALRKDGSMFTVEVSASPLSNGYFQEVIRDISERKKTEEQIVYQALLVDNVFDAIVSTDLNAHILSWNKAAEIIYGWKAEEVLGKPISSVIPAEMTPDEFRDSQEQLSKYGHWEGETVHKRRDGVGLNIFNTLSWYADSHGKPIGLVAVFHDNTEQKKAEQDLRYQAMLIENVSDAIISTDLDSRILSWNKAAETIYGWRREEVIGKKITEILGSFVENDLRATTRQVMENGCRPETFAHKRKNCTMVDISSFLTAVKDAAGKPIGFIAVNRDITEYKKMENALKESERQYRLLVDNQTDILVEIDTKGKLLFVNPAYCKLIGKSSKELIGTYAGLRVHEDDRVHVEQEFQKVLQPPFTLNFETRTLTPAGWRWIAWTDNAVLDKDGKVTAVTCLGRDITESKLAKEELEKANAQLRELDKLKDNFLSTVSHELRTPLTSIKSFAEILLNYDEDRATQKEFLGIINQESDRLTRLVNDFLDLSKIQAGRMQWKPEELSLAEIIRSVVITSRPLIEKAQLEVSLDLASELPGVLCDRDRLTQVITNLLGNAIKFTPENGKITFRAWLEKAGENYPKDIVVASITDTGIGIAKEHHQTIFENFGQVGDVLKDRPRGTGLGLPICKKIIENFGGKIWVESAPGKGTTMYFTLPAVKSQINVASTSSALSNLNRPAAGKTILVVDDEDNIRRFIRHELSLRGHTVMEAKGGREAVDLARKYHPDLITLDISMPDINGFDVTAVLKSDPATTNIPILIISIVEDQQKAYRLGANDYITKPVSIDLLMTRVNNLLKGGQREILVVDDDQALTSSLKFELKKRGFIVRLANSGKLALNAVAEKRPDLMLLDVVMPEINGYDVMSSLKSNAETRGIPIIILTGVEIDGGRVRALSTGAADYVNKSEGFAKLFEAIERHLPIKPAV